MLHTIKRRRRFGLRRRVQRQIATWLLLTCWFAACGDNELDGHYELASGGATTVWDRTSNAFSFPAPTLSAEELGVHLAGDAEFESIFVSDPASVNPGLGPLYNSNACISCHNRDGRGALRFGNTTSSALVRVSKDGAPDPLWGSQLQNHAVLGVQPESGIEIAWETIVGAYADGTPYELRRPQIMLTAAHDANALELSLRIAPPVFGLGLLEAVSEADLLRLADPDDSDGDGVSGRLARLPGGANTEIGRFGWKAAQPSLVAQTAGAYAEDMGVGNRLAGDIAELPDARLDAAAFYVATLGVPGAVGGAGAGRTRFEAFGCASCHVPDQRTAAASIAGLANIEFAPYTDLLLHDMGDELSDGRAEGAASGSEWRTPPLWGLGLTQTVLPGATYLHDGRARDLAEAILWHGGEGDGARQRFLEASAAARAELLDFLQSL